MSTFIKVTRVNKQTKSNDAEEVFVNAASVKLIVQNPDGGSSLHVFGEEIPLQVQESGPELARRINTADEPETLPLPTEINPTEGS